ncbi:hypothetical protein HK102_012081, partial [Quaeritorhiza haematococci]
MTSTTPTPLTNELGRDYSKFFSKRSSARKPSAIRALQKFLSIPGMISLGGGNPHPSTFPFADMRFTLKNGDIVEVGEADMKKALQYSATNGLPEFVDWLRILQTSEHKPPYTSFDICVGNGSQDVLTKAFEMLIEEGEYMLIEAPAYVGSLAFLRPLGAKFVEIPQDVDGLIPEKMEEVLASWENPETKPK